MTPQPAPIVINEWWFVAVVIAAFAYLGLQRGLTIQLFMLLGVAAGILLADPLARSLEPPINSVYQFVEPIVRERIISAGRPVPKLTKPPKLITVEVHRRNLGSVLFVLMVALSFWVGHKRSAKAKPRFTVQGLATLVGAVNGYLVAYFLFPRHITSAETVVEVPTAPITNLLRGQLTVPIMIAVLVLVTIGVLGSRQGRARGK